MQIAILSSESNNNRLMLAIEQAGLTPVVFSLKQPAEKLLDYQGVVITTDKLKVSDPLVTILRKMCVAGDPILGMAEGARILIETGLIPGLENDKVGIKLAVHTQSESTMRLSKQYQYNAFTRLLKPETTLQISESPMSFVIPPALLMEMNINGLTVFNYCDADGNRSNTVAAVSNKTGNVMALIPFGYDPLFFQSMYDYLEKGYRQSVQPLFYYPRN